MKTLVFAMQFNNDPYEVEYWANGLIGNPAPSVHYTDYIVDKVLSLSVTCDNYQYSAFAVCEVSRANPND